jgi:hypothetical protein
VKYPVGSIVRVDVNGNNQPMCYQITACLKSHYIGRMVEKIGDKHVPVINSYKQVVTDYFFEDEIISAK